MAVDPALGADIPVDTADSTSQGHTQDGTTISGPGDGDVDGGNIAVATDVAADESDITADSASPHDGATATTASVVALEKWCILVRGVQENVTTPRGVV